MAIPGINLRKQDGRPVAVWTDRGVLGFLMHI